VGPVDGLESVSARPCSDSVYQAINSSQSFAEAFGAYLDSDAFPKRMFLVKARILTQIGNW